MNGIIFFINKLKNKNRIFILILFLIFFQLDLNAEINELPIYKNAFIIEKPRMTEINSIKSFKISYLLIKNKGVNLNKVESFYISEFSGRGYRKKGVKRKKIKSSFNIKLSFMSDKKLAYIKITDMINENKIFVEVSLTDNEIFFNKKIIQVKNNKDNPGFDFIDIPKCYDCLRLFSMKTEAKESENKDIRRQVTYKSLSSIEALTQFYLQEMKNLGWTQKRITRSEMGNILNYSKNKRKCEIFIIYNKDMKRSIVMIQE